MYFPRGNEMSNAPPSAAGITFRVCDAKPIKERWPPYRGLVDAKKLFEMTNRKTVIEAAGGEQAMTAGATQQGLMDATHYAYSIHMPLVLSPDSLWLTISQGVARHVTLNAEALRPQFVIHEGKKELTIERNQFVKGSPDNDWPGCFEEFSHLIRQNTVAKTYERLICDFSTTGFLEKAISNLTLMDTMSGYFTYGVMTACGIPRFTLLGSPADWKKLYAKAEVLAEYDLSWWTKELLPVLEQFDLAANGEIDKEWWDGFYKFREMSGSDMISGHILKLFPFVKTQDRKTDAVVYERRTQWSQATSRQIPTGMVKVPFTWYYHGQELKMHFQGGLAGVIETPEGLKPGCLWAVTD